MNQAQRNFLVTKLKESTESQIRALNDSKVEFPSLSNYLFHAILKGELELKPQDEIKESLKQKALKAKEGVNWLSEDRMGFEKETTIKLKINDLIVVPENYKKLKQQAQEHNINITKQINEIKAKMLSLETRIQIASDKVLQQIISDVDDMGNISLIDTNIKLLSK
jgi:hypothetical protein